MKKINFAWLIIALFSVFMSSCSKDNSTSPATNTNTPPTYPFTATAGSATFNSNAAGVTAKIMHGDLLLTATSTDNHTISITLSAFTSSGVFPITLTDSCYASYDGYSDNATGTVNITNLDTSAKTITGTFSFKAYNPSKGTNITITAGTFTSIKYTGKISTGNGNGSGPSCTATINGNAWTASHVQILQSFATAITASASDGSELLITLPSSVTTGTFSVSSANIYTIQYVSSAFTYFGASSGTISITTANSTEVQGTFSCTGTGLAVTNGSFTAKY